MGRMSPESAVRVLQVDLVWQVEVFRGAPDPVDVPPAPVRFGTTQVILAEDGTLSTPTEPLLLSPVGLRSIDDEIEIFSYADAHRVVDESEPDELAYICHRRIYHPRMSFQDGGEIRVEGFEEHSASGAMVHAVWLVAPAEPAEPVQDA